MANENRYTHHRHHRHQAGNPDPKAVPTESFTSEELRSLNDGLRKALETDAESPVSGGEERERYRRPPQRKKPVRKKKKAGSWKSLLIVFGVLFGIALTAAASFFILRKIGADRLMRAAVPDESAAARMAEAAGEHAGNTAPGDYEEGIVNYKGERYRYNEDIVSVLFMGIDRSLLEENSAGNMIGNNGQADTLVLGVIDERKGKITLINISRDTIASIARYDVEGGFADIVDLQICLAFAYGDGRESSCENEVRAVSDYFYGIPIAAYAAIDYDGIGVLADVVGGVEVTLADDYFAALDPEMTAGSTVVLDSRRTIMFVRTRDSYTYEANNERMQHQKQFLLSFIEQMLEASKKNFSVPLTLYDSLKGYMVTNLSAADVTYLASKAVAYGFDEKNLRSIEGEIKPLDGHAAFYEDEEKFYEMILEVFYDKE